MLSKLLSMLSTKKSATGNNERLSSECVNSRSSSENNFDNFSNSLNEKEKDDIFYISKAVQWGLEKTNIKENSPLAQELLSSVSLLFNGGNASCRTEGKRISYLIDETLVWHEGALFFAKRGLPKSDKPVLTGVKPEKIAEQLITFMLMASWTFRRIDQARTVIDDRPYWMFDTINDSRTPTECLELDNKIMKADSPFWTNNPIPCGRAECRCSFITLTTEKAHKRLEAKPSDQTQTE